MNLLSFLPVTSREYSRFVWLVPLFCLVLQLVLIFSVELNRFGNSEKLKFGGRRIAVFVKNQSEGIAASKNKFLL